MNVPLLIFICVFVIIIYNLVSLQFQYSVVFDLFKSADASQCKFSPWKIILSKEYPFFSSMGKEPVVEDVANFLILLIASGKITNPMFICGPMTRSVPPNQFEKWQSEEGWVLPDNPLYNMVKIPVNSPLAQDWFTKKDVSSVGTLLTGGIYAWAIQYEPSGGTLSTNELWNHLYANPNIPKCKTQSKTGSTVRSMVNTAMTGAMVGSAGGPAGSVVGFVVGAFAGFGLSQLDNSPSIC